MLWTLDFIRRNRWTTTTWRRCFVGQKHRTIIQAHNTYENQSLALMLHQALHRPPFGAHAPSVRSTWHEWPFWWDYVHSVHGLSSLKQCCYTTQARAAPFSLISNTPIFRWFASVDARSIEFELPNRTWEPWVGSLYSSIKMPLIFLKDKWHRYLAPHCPWHICTSSYYSVKYMSTANEFGKFISYFACALGTGVSGVPLRQAAAWKENKRKH